MPNVTQARPAPLRRAGAGRFTRHERLAYTMLVPVLGSIFLIVTYPFVLAVIQSLQATNGGAFVGLQNYVTGLENPLLYEALAATGVYAAHVDGASGWSQFWRIELYYLRPLLILIVFFRLADVLRVFDHVFILTGGGPGNTTQLLSLYLYRVEFKFSDYGQAAALAVVVLIAISVVYSLVTRVLPLERR